MVEKPKITYSTLAVDNEAVQVAFDEAVVHVEDSWLGADVPMWINGEKVYCPEKVKNYSPIDKNLLVCTSQQGGVDHARAALHAAKAAFAEWRGVPWQERVAIVRAVAEKISANSVELGALMSLEVGKSRLEAMGEVEEAADLMRHYAQDIEKNVGYRRTLGKLNPDDPHESNVSVLRPYGVWAVISPFNFPMALSAAPIAAALLAGNTVVYKGSLETPYINGKLAELWAEAPLPAGTFNSICGPDDTLAQELLDNPTVDGWTFTGSSAVGMKVLRVAASHGVPRPANVEMGGKNPAIVSQKANLDTAVLGIVRAAFGLSGQKCSACSRVYVQKEVYASFKAKLLEMVDQLTVGDPRTRGVFMGTVIHQEAYDKYQESVAMAQRDGTILTGGTVLTEGKLADGFYVTPTVIEGLPEDHKLVREELFLPILHIAEVASLEEAMTAANDTPYGLTAGFFSEDADEIQWFFDQIEAGTVYANRAAGATTGAWPGVQAFGGWKGSGSTGKGCGSYYTMPLYMREQSHTIIG